MRVTYELLRKAERNGTQMTQIGWIEQDAVK
jgi:hypothetical protein